VPDGVVASTVGRDVPHANYGELLRHPEAHYMLHGVVAEEGQTVGQISLYRSATAPAYTAREGADLANVMHYVAHGVVAGESRLVDANEIDFEDSEEEAILVTDRSGAVRHATDEGRRLLMLATNAQIDLQSLQPPVGGGLSSAALRGLAQKLDVATCRQPPCTTFNNGWGRHVLRAYWLSDDRESSDVLVGVRIQRQEPMLVRFVRSMARLRLSPQQREISLRVAQGKSTQEIAKGLGLMPNTVSYHLRQIFMKLRVRSRASMVKRILSSGLDQPVMQDIEEPEASQVSSTLE
jgi:DNA-binding CsgD family transcriptional regulator